ncbi:23S rRNA (guanosine2251-2'-O)-methyltransferase [Dethiosulfatibacter aminovorans DSM 17477]|uniref:23S rRNA (Guanosine2251-2'-O)-methyltransferase n=1 Tax=Dethiosulfatibacter aminovorans DSM 17477 TaxID=1121476 RepID=A0A1M6KG68_9FIRM|nr:23S rRNA (guanosine(2251)-2'-O)-methyltransferase RlmB [Dethiosulfatibacter aminovorans]SHJ57955.1 23S rRNA (guanosine2251-2'-O)-methyltransferase [Dethiosulfatibacter aminovorans DSM 17477]
MRLIIGKNPVLEALNSDKKIERIYVLKKDGKNNNGSIIAMAKKRRITIKEVDKSKLDAMSSGGSHQGVAAELEDFKYSTMDDVIAAAEEREQKPFVVILDGITDVHNLGAIIRSAECAGVHGVVIPERRAAQITDTTAKTSAGALEYMNIVKVKNINTAIQELKDKGFWIYGADMNGDKHYYEEKYDSATALVIGSEGKGISRLVRDNCDVIVDIPMGGRVNSLNASCAASIIIFEVLKQRGI